MQARGPLLQGHLHRHWQEPSSVGASAFQSQHRPDLCPGSHQELQTGCKNEQLQVAVQPGGVCSSISQVVPRRRPLSKVPDRRLTKHVLHSVCMTCCASLAMYLSSVLLTADRQLSVAQQCWDRQGGLVQPSCPKRAGSIRRLCSSAPALQDSECEVPARGLHT
jgi:hypothetical protein